MSQSVSVSIPEPVVYFNFVYIYAGGARSTVQLVRELQCLTDVRVIDAYGHCQEYVASLEQAGVSPIVLLPHWSGRTTVGGTNRVRRLANMFASIPDIAQVVVRLRSVLRNLNPRAIWVDSEKALFMVWLAVPRDVPIVYVARGELHDIRPYCALAWRRISAAVGVSEESLRYLRLTRYARGNLQAIHNGIDVERTLTHARLEPEGLPTHDGSSLWIVFPAYIADPLKGHEVGIRATAKFIAAGGRAELWLCGDVPREVSRTFYDKIRQLACDLGIEPNVHFLGWRDDVPSIMARADMVMLPSFTEGLPRSLLEAMALARPVIATRVGGIPELVRDSIDGILVEPGDVDGIVCALQTLSDPEVRTEMGCAGQSRVRQNFTIRTQAQRFLSMMDILRDKP